MPDVHIFWDNSNIFIPAKFAANRRDGPMLEYAVRIQFDNMYRLASAGRDVASAVCVGSVPPELEAVWDRLEAAGVDVELYERGSGSGTEQGVDQCLQVHMLRALADSDEPAVAVLLTGDGAGYDDGAGFHADLERMAKHGWGIEVLSWDSACNKKLKAWANSSGVYIPLDDYYQSVTFIEKGRRSKELSLTSRPTAKPKTAA
jgi:NYN domain-containing protein